MRSVKLLALVAILAFAVSILLIANRGHVTAHNSAQETPTQRVVRSTVPGVKIDGIRTVTPEGLLPLLEVTFRNVGKAPIAYLSIQQGGSTAEISRLLSGEYIGVQETLVKNFGADSKDEIMVTAVVYADGTAEGEGIALKKATFYYSEFLAAADRYLKTITIARAGRLSDKSTKAQLLAQVEQESNQQEFRTTGALAFAHILTRTLNDENGQSEAEKVNGVLLRLQRLHATATATLKAEVLK